MSRGLFGVWLRGFGALQPGGARVTVRIRVVQRLRADVAGPPVLAQFAIRGGLVTPMESRCER